MSPDALAGQPRKISWKRWAVALACVPAIIIVALLLKAPVPAQSIHVGFATDRGHFPEPGSVFYDQIFVMWVTNTGPSTIFLGRPVDEIKNSAGRVSEDQGYWWNQKRQGAEVSPGNAAWLAFGFDTDKKQVRFGFEYCRKGNFLLTGASAVSGILPLRRLPVRTYDWLRQHGLVDGNLYAAYESPWMDFPHDPARPETSGPQSTK